MNRLIAMVATMLMATLTALAQNGTLNPTNPPEPQLMHRLTLTAQPTEAATVSGDGEYAEGVTVTLRLTAKTNYKLLYWLRNGEQLSATGTQLRIVMPAEDVAYTAVYEYQEPVAPPFNPANPAEPQYITPENALYLVAMPAGCGSFNRTSGTKTKEGTVLTLKATPATGYIFTGWYTATGDPLSTSTTLSYTMPGQTTTLTARFSYNPTNPGEPDGSQDDVANTPGAVTLMARSYTIEYGEPLPSLEYEVTNGTITAGAPVLSCTAPEVPAAGVYDIVIAEGTVTNSSLNLINGSLIVNPAPLTVSAGSYTMMCGDALPTFTPTLTGFKNGENQSVLAQQPTVSTTATSNSRPGTYLVNVGGAQADNYAITYQGGTLTITPRPGDANGDGRVDAADVAIMASYILGLAPADFVEEAADTNGDGIINIVDVTAIIEKAMGK